MILIDFLSQCLIDNSFVMTLLFGFLFFCIEGQSVWFSWVFFEARIYDSIVLLFWMLLFSSWLSNVVAIDVFD